MQEWEDSKQAGAWIRRNREARGWSQAALAEHLGRLHREKTGIERAYSQQTIGQWESGKLKSIPEEMPLLRTLFEGGGGIHKDPDLPLPPDVISYVPIDILPTYAGLGGGGTGRGDVERALIPRYLIEDVFRGRPSDFVVIRVRGDSMIPKFMHDDELLVDKRDRSPSQPGPFAIWDGEWGEYVVKNVERLPGGRLRMFSSNGEYTPTEIMHEETRIIGRPVWFGRRL